MAYSKIFRKFIQCSNLLPKSLVGKVDKLHLTMQDEVTGLCGQK